MSNKSFIQTNQANRLTPITSHWMKRIMNYPEVIQQLIERHGSPINILHPQTFHKNSEQFHKLFSDSNIDGKIYYARKANKCKGFVNQALKSGIGIDTASKKELQQCLALGANGEDLVLTASVKPNDLLELAIKNEVTMIVDNAEECGLIQQVAGELNKKAIIGVRLSGFIVNDAKLYSRFGFDIDSIKQFISQHFIQEDRYSYLTLTGLHFHLDGYSIQERAESLLQTISVYEWLKKEGFPMKFIDIGGGILVNYLQKQSEWEMFQKQLKESVRGEREPITFQNNGLGYTLVNDELHGSLNTYPYYNEVGSMEFLSRILGYQKHGDMSVADHLQEKEIQLRIEPGRAMLNQTGMTVARVVHRKTDTKGQLLVGLQMNMSQMNSSSDDFLLDPFVIYNDKDESGKEPVEVYFTGAYCLEGDLILKRKITLPQLPAIGDKVVFVNTAGYMMHFYERQSHLLPFSKNLNFTERKSSLSQSDFHPDNLL